MRVYFDTSAILPLIVAETNSVLLINWVADAGIEPVVSSFGIGEASVALMRLRRQKIVVEAACAAFINELDDWATHTGAIVETLSSDVRDAIGLVRRFELGLRMPDAVHLCICKHHELPLVTFDAGMRKVAEKLGQLLIGP